MAEGSGSNDSKTNVIADALNSMNFIFNELTEENGMINYDYSAGAFEMDHRDGEIRLRSEIPFYDRYVLSAESISNWLNAIFGTMDYTIPGFIAVAYSNAVPAEIWKNIINAVDPKLN